ncbi:FAD-binding oxidoreductase [Cytophagales bacterium RKSG123]|nr:FAD-dependent oxidoreductase [Xanthovirga aplysinae]MTI30516.1 FAD-binding oxidoreductase [Xanthovirga aplysinae]
MLSYWEKNSFIQYDYIIIGGGIVGLSAAIELKDKLPDVSVLVIERGLFPSGASTKNAGFACFGSLTELLSDFNTMGEEATLELVSERWKGLQILRKRLGDRNIGFQSNGGYELIRGQEKKYLEELDRLNELLWPVFNALVFEERPELISDFGFNGKQVESVVYNQFEGQIDTGLMMRNLIEYAQSKGINILTGAEVTGFEEEEAAVKVFVKNPFSQEGVIFSASKLAICTNAFAKQLVPEADLQPGRGIVVATKPIDGLKFKGVFHYDEGYFYFRNHGNRVILGGGRNLDFEKEATTSFSINKEIQNHLKQQLEEVILPDQDFEVEHTWSGIMAFGKEKKPILKPYSDRIVLGIRLGGMGVAIGSNVGVKIASQLVD